MKIITPFQRLLLSKEKYLSDPDPGEEAGPEPVTISGCTPDCTLLLLLVVVVVAPELVLLIASADCV